MTARLACPWVVALSLFIAGCREPDEGPPIYPVTGRLLVDGEPAARAEVAFHRLGQPTPGLIPPFAVSEPDGTFRPSTNLSHDGAPAGDYALTVVWRKYRTVQGEDVAGEDQLSGRYSLPGKSGLKVTIHPGDNVLPPLELKMRP